MTKNQKFDRIRPHLGEGTGKDGPAFGGPVSVCRQPRKSGEMGRKIATKDCARRRVSERNRREAAALGAEITQEGCLSFSINRFPELFKVLENASSLSKRLFRQAETGPPLADPSEQRFNSPTGPAPAGRRCRPPAGRTPETGPDSGCPPWP